jgi:large subunit ribosomal protein L4
MNIDLYDMSGKVLKQIEISDSVFCQPANEDVIHQALVTINANKRQGTASTKTRSEVHGSTRKLFKQKGTGRARSGNIKSGLKRGGGVIFGPKPRDYSMALPKKMKRQAIRCVLSSKALTGTMKVVDALKFDEPKTKVMAGVIKSLGVEQTAIVAIENVDRNIIKSASNIPGVVTMQARQLNVADLLKYKSLIITEAAVREIEGIWGGAA